MKVLKKMMQVALAIFFLALLATSTVFADDADSEGWQFVQENGRTYYKKGELKETYWRVIDGKYYYFDPLSGEMVVGWQYIPAPHEGVTIGFSIRQDVAFRPDWFYFGQDGVLQIPTNIMGNNMIVQQRNESTILKTKEVITP